MAELTRLYEAVLTGKLPDAIEVTSEAIAENIDPQIIINDYMSKAMEEIGTRFEAGKAFVPELLMAARAMKGALELLKPIMAKAKTELIGTVIIGTVKGDLHDIGKNLVACMLEGCGFEVINAGIDVSAEKFISIAQEHNANIICLSALLTTTMTYMKEVVDAVKSSPLSGKVKIMIGGAPVNESFAAQIGADGYSDNANSAVALAKKLIS